MLNGAPTGLTHLAYRLPGERTSLEALASGALLESSVPLLREIGFEFCYVHDGRSLFEDEMIMCGRDLLSRSGLPGGGIQWLVRYSGLEAATPEDDTVLSRFRYPVGRAQHELNLPAANPIALSQQGCSGLLSSLFLADKLLRTGDADAVLCLAGDALPAGSGREILYNVISDAAAAVLVEKSAAKNRILHFYQHTAPYYWDTPEHVHEILASYFPLAQRVIRKGLEQIGRSMEEVAWIVPHNVSWRSWKILADLLGVPEGRIWSKNIARVGHTVSCDHVINLHDMEAEGVLCPGDLLVLFTFGFGANWTCMILEH